MKKIIFLLTIAFCSFSFSQNHQVLDYRPDFIDLTQETLSEDHIRQASLGHLEALIEARYVNFDLDGLNVIKGEDGRFYNIPKTEMSGHEISLNLPGEENTVLLFVENVQNLIHREDVVTYTGHTAEDSNNFFTISISDEGIMGKVNYGKYIFIITPLADDNKHTIAKLDKSLMVKDTLEQDLIESQAKLLLNQVEKSSSGSGRVDILFYYGTDVSSPALLVGGIVSEMNSILTNSGISSNNEIYSVGLLSTGTTFPGLCKIQVLNKMSLRQNEFSNIDQDMSLYGADLAFTILGDNSASGCVAGQPGRVGGVAAALNTSTLPFAVSAQAYALGDLTAPHEIGHVLGGKHSNRLNIINGTESYSRGKTFTIPCTGLCKNKPKQTIMGGYDTAPCDFTGVNSSCERIGNFSNPSISYSGVPTGDIDSRDMKTWLNTNMPVVSGWRGTPLPPPIAPNPVSVQSDSCYGFNTVSWTSVTSATDYRLYKSTSSSFTNPVLLYSGTSTNTGINVNSGTWFLRAQACNSSGCSLNSSQVSATIYNGCQ